MRSERSALEELKQELATTIRTFKVEVDSLTDEGVDIALERIYQLKEGCTSDWLVAGKFIVANNLSLFYSEDSDEWSVSDCDGLPCYLGSTPCIAVAKFMVAKKLLMNPGQQYVLRMPYESAKELIEKTLRNELTMIMADGAGVKDTDTVELVLLPGL